jgi:exopolysaccharide biosynthesis polyprenyl glycosylphosphotransferase
VLIPLTIASLPIWLLLAKLYGLYDNDHRVLRHLTVDELPSLIVLATTGTAAQMLVVSLLGQHLAATEALAFWICAALATPVLRAGARATWRRIVPAERALLVGSGPLEVATRRKLDLFKDIHVQCVGMLSDETIDAADDIDAILSAAISESPGGRLDRVIVAGQTVSEPLIAELVRLCRQGGLKLSVVPPARAMFGTAVRLHHVADLPLIEYSTWDVPRSTMLIKRTLDAVASALALVALSPVLLAVAAAVRLTSRGPVLFVQVRAGRDGKPFRMLKFRTMVADAENRLEQVVDLAALDQPAFKLREDPRVTRVGRILRRTSLDELPQLVNVLRGDMSLIGPRPEQVELVERYAPEHRVRLDVRPGLTGPMQVYGRGELRFDERLAVEREYVENLSLRRDVRILLLTLATVVRGHGAY